MSRRMTATTTIAVFTLLLILGGLQQYGPRLGGAIAEASAATSTGGEQINDAVCVLVPFGKSGVRGTLHFVREGDKVHITGEITGLTPGMHGFHVHEFGDLTDSEAGKSAGGHYNPTDQPHGRMTDKHRHVGDLGNITANDEGVAKVDKTDDVIKLNGPHSIIGRAIIVHADSDKFTQPSGDAGARVAGGVIGIARSE